MSTYAPKWRVQTRWRFVGAHRRSERRIETAGTIAHQTCLHERQMNQWTSLFLSCRFLTMRDPH